ncbi:MAG: hypothetical protein WCP97_03425 [bacterium]
MGIEGVFMFIFLAGLLTITSFILFLILKNKKGEHFQFSSRNLFLFYLYFMTFVSLITFTFGCGFLLKSGFAIAFGPDFVSSEFRSQTVPTVKEQPCTDLYAPGKDTSISDASRQQYIKDCEDERVRAKKELETRRRDFWKENLLNGLSLALIGGLVLLFHSLGMRAMIKDEDSHLIYRLFLIYNVVFFGVASIVTLSIAVYSTLRYFILSSEGYYGAMPGELLPYAIVFTPVWIYFIWSFWGNVKREG